MLARLIPEKGLVELIEDLATAPGAWRELRVAGERQDLDYVSRFEDRVRTLGLSGRVHLLGHVNNVPDFLSAVDAVVVPSVGNEGQPTVVIEALAAGMPVLVRRPIYSEDFAGLPVMAFNTPAELHAGLTAHEWKPAPPEELKRRFGPDQAIAALEAAAARGR